MGTTDRLLMWFQSSRYHSRLVELRTPYVWVGELHNVTAATWDLINWPKCTHHDTPWPLFEATKHNKSNTHRTGFDHDFLVGGAITILKNMKVNGKDYIYHIIIMKNKQWLKPWNQQSVFHINLILSATHLNNGKDIGEHHPIASGEQKTTLKPHDF